MKMAFIEQLNQITKLVKQKNYYSKLQKRFILKTCEISNTIHQWLQKNDGII